MMMAIVGLLIVTCATSPNGVDWPYAFTCRWSNMAAHKHARISTDPVSLQKGQPLPRRQLLETPPLNHILDLLLLSVFTSRNCFMLIQWCCGGIPGSALPPRMPAKSFSRICSERSIFDFSAFMSTTAASAPPVAGAWWWCSPECDAAGADLFFAVAIRCTVGKDTLASVPIPAGFDAPIIAYLSC